MDAESPFHQCLYCGAPNDEPCQGGCPAKIEKEAKNRFKQNPESPQPRGLSWQHYIFLVTDEAKEMYREGFTAGVTPGKDFPRNNLSNPSFKLGLDMGFQARNKKTA
ncbi:MAG: hypothetical protein COV34_02230 [Candidatus Zambryskibacteria bacterium CG10_big_fil_rev_8_21_14_0_10_42_12]|uniref:Uncharacterized protein n=1 Tax=Candidatus Zambryskibacteria bacterium CG10_big_fil_rev_8_21_14_0_10_42_12 TaxID=1975115 RepID=A0A2H0QVU5_9BACT|nr:MAG: hypothetical protein COV34_02230 [Candidatus Zambryskibacteria bacterium CG10_big_fil_rev_8_21_14_0_10_42_12]